MAPLYAQTSTRIAWLGCIFSVSVVSSVITRVALSPGMQPATTPSRVAPKASVRETGLRYPTTALPNMTRPSNMLCGLSGQADQKNALERQHHHRRDRRRQDGSDHQTAQGR